MGVTGADSADMPPVVATANELEGATVHDAEDTNVGSIAEVVNGANGPLAVMNVGGFLGLGAHRIALPVDDLDIVRDADTDSVTVRVGATLEQLKAMPAYEG
jgi:ribosomal 30S subunit maturation factor RimM